MLECRLHAACEIMDSHSQYIAKQESLCDPAGPEEDAKMEGTLHAMSVPPSSPHTIPQAEYYDVSPNKRVQNANTDVLYQIINEVSYEVRTQLRAMREDVSELQIMGPERQGVP